MMRKFFQAQILVLVFIISTCASGSLTVIQRFGGNILASNIAMLIIQLANVHHFHQVGGSAQLRILLPKKGKTCSKRRDTV